jgi:hypothetical protein
LSELKREFLEVRMPLADFIQFLVAASMAVVGLALFIFGVKLGLLPLGEYLGSDLPGRGAVMVILFGFLLGFVVTVAEPDVRIFASQVDSTIEGFASQSTFIYAISLGVGISVVLAMLRTIFDLQLIYLLLPGYALIFFLGFFVPEGFFSVAFDSGAVTTGPITVPFLLALYIGVASVLGGRSGVSQGFGLIALASVGPIIAVMLLGVFFG